MDQLREHKGAVIASLICPFLVIIGFICYEFFMVATGVPVSLVVQGYDPSDFLRGNYILYDHLIEDVVIADPIYYNFSDDKFYYRDTGHIILLDTDGDGVYDDFGDFYWSEPSQPYFLAECSIYHSQPDEPRIYFLDNQNRFYLDQELAPDVEDDIRDVGSFNITGTVNKGVFRAESIKVAGRVYH